ncbi:MAG: invasion associated locus B family protein [Alphaproteobacteria bacterium]
MQAQDAKPKVGERIGDWTFQCQAVAADQNVCGIIQTIADNKTRRQVLAVAVRPVGKDKRIAMFVTAPLGIFLGSGIGGKIDDGEQFKFNLQTCNQRSCQAGIAVEKDRLSELKKGQRLLVGFKARADANTITVPVSLKGFTAGRKAMGAE